MTVLFAIATRHLLARKRQSIVSLLGIILGVAFFLAISSLMQGSEADFIRRLVDNTPHITVSDEFREPRKQPVFDVYPNAVIGIERVKPVTETRGIRGFQQVIDNLRREYKGIRVSAVLVQQALVSAAGKNYGITLNGMIPIEIRGITTIEEYIIQGSLDDMVANPDGVLIGSELARKLSLNMGDNITVSTSSGQVKVLKIVGIFRTGRASYDESQVFSDIKKVQSLTDRANRANSMIIKLDDSGKAREIAASIEKNIGYKAVSWQEANEDILSTLVVRNTIMYTVVSAVLVVAAFGIYNVISTVVLEKQKDIAIMKSMGFHAGDIKKIFIIQGIILGLAGCFFGLPLGAGLMRLLMMVRLKPPGATDLVNMPLDWSWPQFAVAAAFAIIAAVVAALLPARKASSVQPVDILRGS